MFFAGFAGKVTPLLLLDYDGTLAPFRVDRFLARPWAGVRELLTRIQQQGRTRMAIISGRSAHEIRPLLGIDPPLKSGVCTEPSASSPMVDVSCNRRRQPPARNWRCCVRYSNATVSAGSLRTRRMQRSCIDVALLCARHRSLSRGQGHFSSPWRGPTGCNCWSSRLTWNCA